MSVMVAVHVRSRWAAPLALVAALAAAVQPAAAVQDADGQPAGVEQSAAVEPAVGAVGAVVPGSYIVTLRSGDAEAVAGEHGRRHRLSVSHVYPTLGGYAARMSASEAAQVAADSRVASVVADRHVSAGAQVVPPGVDRVDADLGSTVAGDSRGRVDADIAVLDTGIVRRHGDLTVRGGVNCVPGELSWEDLNGHGTHVAGIAAARDNHRGVVGVAPGARLWAVRVLDATGAGTWASVICGVDWVTAHADVIEVANMSLGSAGPEGSCTDGGLREAICRSVAAGVTYVAGAGNAATDASGFVPATYQEVLTVSAVADFDGRPGGLAVPTCPIGADDTFAPFSNFGSDVDLAAPGVCVLSTWPGGGYATLSGTSMASPHVAGAAALYLAGHPGASPAQVRAALLAAGTSDWVGDPDGTVEPLVNVAGF